VVGRIERQATERSAPRYVRFDYGPEFIAYAAADWCHFNGTDTYSSIRVNHGRTPGSNRSTAGLLGANRLRWEVKR
jgi:hypothetical protein